MINKVLSIVVSLFVATVSCAPDDDKFTQLPNFTFPMPTDSYSGYLDVNENKSLHYVFISSENDPTTDPVVIWFNGGPGCSSMLAFTQENGPIVIDDDLKTFTKNPYPWNANASMLYLESPAGVGFSWAADEAAKTHSDMSQSEDAYAAIVKWYEKFPEFKSNPLYVSGESYGGVYVPYLSYQIVMHNNGTDDKIPLKGFLVGNGATNWDYDVGPSYPQTLYNFNMLSKKNYTQYMDNECAVFFNGVRNTTCKNQTTDPSANCSLCDTWMDDMMYYNIYGLNWYDLYRKAEPMLSEEERVGTTVINGEKRTYKRGFTMAEYTPWLKHHAGAKQQVLGTFLSDYLNQDDVRQALHIKSEIGTWAMCNDVGSLYILNATAKTAPSVWIYPIMRDAGVRMMFYSGDTDGAVSTYGSKLWINNLEGFCLTADWKAWYTKGQVSGYIKQWEHFDFITIKGVGHMAPQWARKPMADLITDWIHKPASEIPTCPHPETEAESQQFIQ